MSNRLPSSSPKAVSPSARAARDAASTAALVAAATAGCGEAWAALMRRFGPVVRTVARDHRLAPHDADEVAAACWLALLEDLPKLRDPDRLGAWLVTAARRQALRRRREAARLVLLEPATVHDREPPAPDATEPAVIEAERARALRAALARLPQRQRALLEALLAEPEPTYTEVAQRLEVPRGSIGPTRARGLERLRQDPVLQAALAA